MTSAIISPPISFSAGVPLNTVRDLLGDSSVQLSLPYTNLPPHQRREAVPKLNKLPIALTLSLPWEGLPPTWRPRPRQHECTPVRLRRIPARFSIATI